MAKYNEFKTIEEITGEDLKSALVELYENMGGAVSAMHPITFIELPDGTFAQVFVSITTQEDDFTV